MNAALNLNFLNAKTMTDIVYICSPYQNDIQNNIKNAQKFCKFAVDKGYCPFAPHLFFPQFLNDNIAAERNKGFELNKNFLSLAQELWVFGKNITAGMIFEIQYFQRLQKIIKYFDFDFNFNFKEL